MEQTKANYLVETSTIKYDITKFDVDPDDVLSERQVELEIKNILEDLPQALSFEFECLEKDIYDKLQDAIMDEVLWWPKKIIYTYKKI